MKKPHPPYVGISGITTLAEVKKIITSIPDGFQRKVAMGVLVSHVTLEGYKNNFPMRYPSVDAVKKILVRDERTLNIIHFSPGVYPLYQASLEKIMDLWGDAIDGIQINTQWPDPLVLHTFKRNHPHARIILQVALRGLQSKKRGVVKNVMEYIARYAGSVDDILFDQSLGKHIPVNVSVALPFIEYMTKHQSQFTMSLGIAGGLSGKNLGILKPLLLLYPNLSVDAESALRTQTADILMIRAARRYLERASRIF